MITVTIKGEEREIEVKCDHWERADRDVGIMDGFCDEWTGYDLKLQRDLTDKEYDSINDKDQGRINILLQEIKDEEIYRMRELEAEY